MIWQLLLQVILIALNAVFSCAETAVISVSQTRLDKLADEGSKKAERLQKLTREPSRILAALRVAITLSGFIGAAFAADSFADDLLKLVLKTGIGIPAETMRPIAMVLVTLILSYITLVFGELIPKRAAMKNPERLALNMSGGIGVVQTIFKPLVFILNVSANGILRLMGIDPKSEDDTVSEEEIIMMSDAGAEKGVIDETESRMIKNVFAFDDLTAEQICTHRTDVSILWSEDDVKTWEETIHRTRHSRYPVCGESVDNVIGILDAKDYFRLQDKSRENIMKNAVHEPYFVHETMKADTLFAQMKKKGGHGFAVVVDEYGGMSGVITVTDLVEELVGDFDDDESGLPEKVMKKLDDRLWSIPGITPLDEVCEELEIDLQSEKYDTFGGYIIDELGEIPKDGTKTSIESDGLHIEILEIRHHRVELCRVTKLETDTGESDENEK